MKVNPWISDLFFNHDLSEAHVHDGAGKFAGYDDVKLREEAALFLNCLYQLGVAVPTIDELIADYYNRT